MSFNDGVRMGNATAIASAAATASKVRVIDFNKEAARVHESGVSLEVRGTRKGVRVGCTLVTWEAWDEIKRIVNEAEG